MAWSSSAASTTRSSACSRSSASASSSTHRVSAASSPVDVGSAPSSSSRRRLRLPCRSAAALRRAAVSIDAFDLRSCSAGRATGSLRRRGSRPSTSRPCLAPGSVVKAQSGAVSSFGSSEMPSRTPSSRRQSAAVRHCSASRRTREQSGWATAPRICEAWRTSLPCAGATARAAKVLEHCVQEPNRYLYALCLMRTGELALAQRALLGIGQRRELWQVLNVTVNRRAAQAWLDDAIGDPPAESNDQQ